MVCSGTLKVCQNYREMLQIFKSSANTSSVGPSIDTIFKQVSSGETIPSTKNAQYVGSEELFRGLNGPDPSCTYTVR